MSKAYKSKRTRRILSKKEPQVVENVKTAMFIRGSQTSAAVNSILHDLYMLKKPYSVQNNQKEKNQFRPMDDPASVEFLSSKHDASLFVFGSHSKKRPNNIVIGRLFDNHILDMMELGVENFKSMDDFDEEKCSIGNKPCFLFIGEEFSQREDFKKVANLLVDFYRGTIIEAVNLAGLETVIVCSAVGEKIHFRVYRIYFKKSGVKTPFVELKEMGPSMDLTVRRYNFAPPDIMRRATQVPREIKGVKIKNVSHDTFTTQGRIHLERQDLGQLANNTKKVKAFRSKRKADSEGSSIVTSKKSKVEE